MPLNAHIVMLPMYQKSPQPAEWFLLACLDWVAVRLVSSGIVRNAEVTFKALIGCLLIYRYGQGEIVYG